MHETAPTMTATLPPKNKQPHDLRHEAAVLNPREAVWLAWYMCLLSLALAGLGLVLLLVSRGHPGVPVFGQWAEDAVVAVGVFVIRAPLFPPLPPRKTLRRA